MNFTTVTKEVVAIIAIVAVVATGAYFAPQANADFAPAVESTGSLG